MALLSLRRRTGDQQSTPAPIHRMREYISGKEGDDTRSVSERCAVTCFGNFAVHEPCPSPLPHTSAAFEAQRVMRILAVPMHCVDDICTNSTAARPARAPSVERDNRMPIMA